MKALFLHFHDFYPHSGISKKIFFQVSAIKECGLDVSLCHMTIDEKGYQRRVCNDIVIDDYGNGIMAKFLKWVCFGPIVKYILANNIEFVYIRSFYNTNPSLLRMLKRLKKANVKVVMEIPTYPYDIEVKSSSLSLSNRMIFFVNKLYRNSLKKYLTKIVTFSDYKEIHGVKTINISNGIDFDCIKQKSNKKELSNMIRLLGVAEIHYWHGYDRLIKGLAEYYKSKVADVEVSFDIVGGGVPSEVSMLKKLTKDLDLDKYVFFHGESSGEELDDFFEKSDFGIASLGRHRSGITKIKTLKTREYAARGIPFVYSETDEDFDNMPYILKAPADESPIDVNKIVSFYESLKISPSEIRGTIINTLSWRVQMQKVIDETFNSL